MTVTASVSCSIMMILTEISACSTSSVGQLCRRCLYLINIFLEGIRDFG